MKKSIINTATIIAFAAFIFVACKKKETTPETPATTNPTTTTGSSPSVGGFTWTINGGSNVVADSSYYYSQYNTIHAYKTGKHFEINLTSLNVGSYQTTPSASNTITYDAGDYYASNSGTLSITANASNKISGNYSCTFSPGTFSAGTTYTASTGIFVDVPKK